MWIFMFYKMKKKFSTKRWWWSCHEMVILFHFVSFLNNIDSDEDKNPTWFLLLLSLSVTMFFVGKNIQTWLWKSSIIFVISVKKTFFFLDKNKTPDLKFFKQKMNEWMNEQCDQWICNRFFVFRMEKVNVYVLILNWHTHTLVVCWIFVEFFCTRTKNSIKSNACLMKGIKRKTESSLNRWKLTFFPFPFGFFFHQILIDNGRNRKKSWNNSN